ncbi:hypothetical protein BN946_scf184836.g23 [Trametes cinnabarina]|uniref:Enoyl reductase (ER) domain-containing protein n=1 Tax=Pycnoporus cinnabarinus TaxID=5643 RepID=A0A060SCE3_PYCCI|nr:hypothetical protein BN946_scf184836.g23 [Trametes cinnabarina]
MSSIPSHQHALVVEKKLGPLQLKQVDVPEPGKDEFLVRVEAAALNPVDWKILYLGIPLDKFPSVLGFDGAGVVVKVGSEVNDYAVGDRVLFQAGFHPVTGVLRGTFQSYTIANSARATKVPANLSFEEAAGIPSVLCAAAVPLYSRAEDAPSAKLVAPWEEDGKGHYAGKPIFILGGASSIGQYVIQLARLSGFSPIIATASLHNAELLESLGATHVLDRTLPSDSVVKEAWDIAGGPIDLVFDTISSAETLATGYRATSPEGDFIYVLPDPIPGADEKPQKRAHFVRGFFDVPFNRDVSKSLLANLPEIFESGQLKPNRVEILPGGLHGVAGGLDRLRNNQEPNDMAHADMLDDELSEILFKLSVSTSMSGPAQAIHRSFRNELR